MSAEDQTKARIEQARERDDQVRRQRESRAVEKAFQDSPIRFKQSNDEVLRFLPKPIRFVDGAPFAGEMPLAVALEDMGRLNPQSVASTVAEIHGGGFSTIKAKSDLRTAREVADYINRNGGAAYEMLPLRAPQEVDESKMTLETFRKLPVRVKSQLVAKHGSGDFIARLPRR